MRYLEKYGKLGKHISFVLLYPFLYLFRLLFVCPLFHSFVRSLFHAFVHLRFCSFVCSLFRMPISLFIRWRVRRLFIRLFVCRVLLSVRLFIFPILEKFWLKSAVRRKMAWVSRNPFPQIMSLKHMHRSKLSEESSLARNQLRTNQFLDCVSYCNKQKSLILANSHFFFCKAAIHMTHPRNGNYSTSIKYRDRESDLAPPPTFEATGRVRSNKMTLKTTRRRKRLPISLPQLRQFTT